MTGTLDRDGWELLNLDKIDGDVLIEIAGQYGTPFPDSYGKLVQLIVPKVQGNGVNGSLSYKYGLSDFPFHTDTSFYTIPARYLLMSCSNSSSSCSNIVDFKPFLDKLSADDLSSIKNATYIMRTPESSKFCKVQFDHENLIGLRYDPNIMSPYNNSAMRCEILIKHYLTTTAPIKIEWTGNNVLIIDNWRCLHSRDAVIDTNRLLYRIYIR